MAAPALNLDLSGIAIGQPRVPDPIYNALASIQTTMNSIGNVHIAADAGIEVSKTTLGTYTAPTAWTPTFSGYSANPTVAQALYWRLGSVGFVMWRNLSNGTSNATDNKITNLPLTPAATMTSLQWYPIMRACNAGSQFTGAAAQIVGGSTTATLVTDANGTLWTNSGLKGVGDCLLVFPV